MGGSTAAVSFSRRAEGCHPVHGMRLREQHGGHSIGQTSIAVSAVRGNAAAALFIRRAEGAVGGGAPTVLRIERNADTTEGCYLNERCYQASMR